LCHNRTDLLPLAAKRRLWSCRVTVAIRARRAGWADGRPAVAWSMTKLEFPLPSQVATRHPSRRQEQGDGGAREGGCSRHPCAVARERDRIEIGGAGELDL